MKHILLAFGLAFALSRGAEAAAPRDLSGVRGFNYFPASVTGEQIFLQYDDAEVNRDFGYAQKLGMNQVRTFLRYSEWSSNTPKFRESFVKLLAAVKRHGFQVMFVLAPPRPNAGASQVATDAQMTAWLNDVLGLARGHSEILAWDVANEPDWIGYADSPRAKTEIDSRMASARKLADFVHAFDRNYLTTVGCWNVACIEVAEPYTDILTYHDYSPTRELIAANAMRAKTYAARVGKPVMQTEVGAANRASPYDMALREYYRIGMGTYIWELMIGKSWGDSQGLFYPDGTVRDPVIAAAVMGIFRNEGNNRVLENPDRESWVTTPLQRGAKWLAAASPDWNEGLEIAETEADMLEANQLVAMRFPPTLAVQKLRLGPPNMPALRAVLQEYAALLTPYAGLGRQHGN
ncbi:MAG: cellulase family glycosylhydrolase [Alphaproteobacteria bacterium]|nr:cellulase family glycosylhydrolase [Alphaproteobacteria bacterium]